MVAKEIKLKNFRNYEEKSFSFSPEVNVIVGKNGAGKTNLLEGIYLFSQGRSFRGTESELIKKGEEFSKILLSFESKRQMTGEIILEKKARKKIRLNSIVLEKVSSLLGNFFSVLFTPDELNLIKGFPEGRRHLIDSAIIPLKPKYIKTLGAYNVVLAQKRAVLKSGNLKTLDIWNEKIADLCSEICFERRKYIERLKLIAKEEQKEFSSGKEILDIVYNPCASGEKKEEIKENIYKKLFEQKDREIEYRSCLVGSHREDIDFIINDSLAKNFASQGQMRTAVLCVKISQAKIIEEETEEKPVFLLDDVLSELDSLRRDFLKERISKNQAIITSTEADGLLLKSNIIKIGE